MKNLTDTNQLGQMIRSARKSQGLTQEQLAATCGIGVRFLRELEHGKAQIINIIHDGISDLALKRAQYTSIIDRDGFPALLAKLVEKIAMYEEKTNGKKR